MSSINSISIEKLSRLVGTPRCVLIDVRGDADFAADPRLLPGSLRRGEANFAEWAPSFAGQAVVIACRDGRTASPAVAARLRAEGVQAEALEGGLERWAAASLPMVVTTKLPARDAAGRTVWVTRERPKIDRIACPWLVRRFVDPAAVFLFVAPAEMEAAARQARATPFDVEGVFFSHRGERCTFDTMLDEFGLDTEPLRHLATIVRAADTARPALSPEAPGLLAVSLGLSRMYSDDLQQLQAGMAIYDALYRWCRDATDETHNWPAAKKSTAPA